MTTLAEHWDGGYLGNGWHRVKVVGYRMFESKKGNPGVEFEMQSLDTGAKTKAGFMLMEQTYWAQFAQACGLTREQAKAYNPDNQNHHRTLVGCELWVEVMPDRSGQYHEAANWQTIDQNPLAAPKVDRSAEMTPTAAEANRDDGCPF